ncbi:hypothetical protein [Gordonia rubripertincta]|uniref:hypothetical protein n=1 Tax=Gordonia rubripertincta TaxID=36822 RepID=UPI0015FA7CD2|nr:hypothetical protein [Gordonia rubripertincta]QMU19324.1 hypothetical protein H3V45_14620 [Gordonia rubripertincta]
MTIPNLEQIDQFAEIVWRKACDRTRAAEGHPPTTAKWDDVVTQDEWRDVVTDVVAAIRDSGLTVIALPEPNSRGRWASSHSFSDPGYLDWSVGVNGSVPFARARRGKGPESSAAQDHADFGAAILAAAQVAERNNP